MEQDNIAIAPSTLHNEVTALFTTLLHRVFDELTGDDHLNAMSALHAAMRHFTAAHQLESLLALRDELDKPVIAVELPQDTCPHCHEGQGGCCCFLPPCVLLPEDQLPV